MNKVIVTGAAGFIGRHFVEYLCSIGVSVTCIVRSGSSVRWTNGSNIKKIVCNLDSINELPDLIKDRDFDAFYHFAWEGSTGELRGDYRLQALNSVYAYNAAKSAKKLGCRKFIATGSVSENLIDHQDVESFNTGNFPYCIAKRSTFEILKVICRELELPFVWAQLSNIFGLRHNGGNIVGYTLGKITQNQRASYGLCNQYYDLMNIHDAVNALYLMGLHAGIKKSYFVGSGQPQLLRDYLLEIGDIFQCPELIGIGDKGDDGMLFKKSWFDTKSLQRDFNFQVSKSFSESISEIRKFSQ